MFVPITGSDVPRIVVLMNRAYRGIGTWSTEAGYLSGDRTTDELLRADLAEKPKATPLRNDLNFVVLEKSLAT